MQIKMEYPIHLHYRLLKLRTISSQIIIIIIIIIIKQRDVVRIILNSLDC